MGVCTNIAAALTAHMREPLVVTQACKTLRILALQAWRPAASNKSVASKRAPTNHEIVLGFDVGSKSSETGRKAIIEARAHLARLRVRHAREQCHVQWHVMARGRTSGALT